MKVYALSASYSINLLARQVVSPAHKPETYKEFRWTVVLDALPSLVGVFSDVAVDACRFIPVSEEL